MQVILTHENADFDAIASLLGAHKLYPNAQPVLPRRVNRNVQAFLTLYGADLPFLSPSSLKRGQHIQRVILVDTQNLTTVRGMGKVIREVSIIDHHTPPTELPPGWSYQGEMLGATTTLLIEALSARLIPISRIEATLMLAGIYEDTGSLTYAATSARDLRAAAWLLDQGANLEIATELLEHPLSPAQQTIYASLKKNVILKEIDGHTVALSWAESPPNIEEEISTLAHKLRDLLAPSALLILVGISCNTQLVARSSSDDIDVAAVARHFGGGGHSRAAAALIRHKNVDELFAELQQVIAGFVRPRIKVGALMSHGVRMVNPQTNIETVAKQMLRTGHEGFPVVSEEGQVIGLVTRNAVDRALQHKWGRHPVHRIMNQGEVTVSPEDSIEKVRALMIQSGWGQIPVVTDGRISGVVTRTDMIRLPPSEQESDRQKTAQQMEEAFPAPLLTLIRKIGAKAAAEKQSIYFVGGVVRDLLLGQPIFDADLVVEGDAITLGKALAEEFGGETRSHRRFGTVKWLLPENIWGKIMPGTHPISTKDRHNLPAFIDLVSARTEFYEHPTALPLVERSSIKQDLHRRDFTINTLAIRLDPQGWGEILDFYGGRVDLQQGTIRVLHSLSFVDDPTRILRAARFEARLGFSLDPRSEALIAEALPLLERITGGRIRHEFDLIFQEPQPEAALQRLANLGTLNQLDPTLVCDAWTREHFARLRQTPHLDLWGVADEAGHNFLYWVIFLYRVDNASQTALLKRFLMPRRLKEGLQGIEAMRTALTQAATLHKPGEIAAIFDMLSSDVLALGWITNDDPTILEYLSRYVSEWRDIQPELKGEDLKRLGLKPGPVYHEIFNALRAARRDGTLSSHAEELEYVREIRQTAEFESPTT